MEIWRNVWRKIWNFRSWMIDGRRRSMMTKNEKIKKQQKK